MKFSLKSEIQYNRNIFIAVRDFYNGFTKKAVAVHLIRRKKRNRENRLHSAMDSFAFSFFPGVGEWGTPYNWYARVHKKKGISHVEEYERVRTSGRRPPLSNFVKYTPPPVAFLLDCQISNEQKGVCKIIFHLYLSNILRAKLKTLKNVLSFSAKRKKRISISF